jgi:hypothetical protein
VTSLKESSYGEVGDNREKWGEFWEKSIAINPIFSLVPSDNRNTKSTCPTSVFTGIGQTLMSRPELQL